MTDLEALAKTDTRTIYAIYADEQFGNLTPIVGDTLGDMQEMYGELEVKYALLSASYQNARNLRYRGRCCDIGGHESASRERGSRGSRNGRGRMKAISLWQPWATLIAQGSKWYETRSWSTGYRGTLVIHAAKTKQELLICNTEPFFTALTWRGMSRHLSWNTQFPLGAAVCVVDLVDVYPTEEIREKIDPLEIHFGNYGDGRYAWELDNLRRFEHIEMRGRQGLFDLELEERGWIQAELAQWNAEHDRDRGFSRADYSYSNSKILEAYLIRVGLKEPPPIDPDVLKGIIDRLD